MSVINQVDINGSTYNIQGNFYGTCSTSASTAAKSITCSEFGSSDLQAGVTIIVIFDNGNTADSPTLNINSTGAKNIYYAGMQITSDDAKLALLGACQFVYDGTRFHLLNANFPSASGVSF